MSLSVVDVVHGRSNVHAINDLVGLNYAGRRRRRDARRGRRDVAPRSEEVWASASPEEAGIALSRNKQHTSQLQEALLVSLVWPFRL